jgi:hypothetical protein
MFQADVPTTESMPDALSVPTNHHNSPISINSPDNVTVFPTNGLNDSEERPSAIGGKRKNRRSKDAGSSKIVVVAPQGVINGSAKRTKSSGALNDSSHVPDLDRELELNFVQKDLSEEEVLGLAERIRNSWNQHQFNKMSVAKKRGYLKILRLQLSAELYTYKTHLVRAGRAGGWASFLRERDIPLSTADRYAKQHESSLAPSEEQLLTEEIKAPTLEDISKLVKKLEPKLRRVLTTPESVTQFMSGLEVILGRPGSPA